jgi:hypothetical protein
MRMACAADQRWRRTQGVRKLRFNGARRNTEQSRIAAQTTTRENRCAKLAVVVGFHRFHNRYRQLQLSGDIVDAQLFGEPLHTQLLAKTALIESALIESGWERHLHEDQCWPDV